jgi:predicted ATPase
VTITGSPGIGKTRLAIEAAASLRDDFEDGVFFVGLAPVRDPVNLPAAIAGSLGLRTSGDQTHLEAVTNYLHTKQALLVLDNFEQILESAPMAADLLEACPYIKLLVTSRSALRIRAESQFTLAPPGLPDNARSPVELISHSPAVAMFVDRARAVCPDLSLTEENAPLVVEICQHLEGVPLAIELAAAASDRLSLPDLAEQLNRRLATLTDGFLDLLARQRSLRSAIDWSYHLLPAAEKELFDSLGVFRGGCTIEAAAAIAGQEQIEVRFTSLVNKNLLRETGGESEERRCANTRWSGSKSAGY